MGTDISWMEVTNQWAQHFGATVFSIPISVKNIGTESGGLNPFDFNMFGSHGLSLDSVGSSFDTDITWEGSMRQGATQEGSLYFLYVGDGQYAIEFVSGFGMGNLLDVNRYETVEQTKEAEYVKNPLFPHPIFNPYDVTLVFEDSEEHKKFLEYEEAMKVKYLRL